MWPSPVWRKSKRGRYRKPAAAQVRQQDQQLGDDAERGAHPEEQLLARGEAGRQLAVLRRPVDHEVGDEHQHRDDVVGDRRPHHRAEPAAGVEDLPDQHEHAVEEDLRQAVAGEVDDRRALRGQRGLAVRRVEVDRHHQRRRRHQQQRDAAEEEAGQGDHPVGVGVAAVRVVLQRPHQLRHQHGVEDAAGQQDVEHVRDRVGDRELVGVQLVAQRGQQQQRSGAARSAGRRPCRPPSPRWRRAPSAGRTSSSGLPAGAGGGAQPAYEAHHDGAEEQGHARAQDQPDHVADLRGPDRQLVAGAQRDARRVGHAGG